MAKTTFLRAVTLLGGIPLLSGSLLFAAPAAHAAIPACTGTPAVDFFVVGGLHTKITSSSPSPTQTNYCIELFSVVQAVVAVKSNVTYGTPSVTSTPGTGSCAVRIFEMNQPATLSLSIGVTTVPTFCFGKDGTTTTVSFGGPSIGAIPDVEVWIPAYSYFNTYGYCAPQFALYTAAPTSANGNNWSNCYSRDNQVI